MIASMSVTLHTSHGDLKVEVFCDSIPLASENFLSLAASNYYDNTIFHRNIKDFMIQGGDPSKIGKGGDSIWGKPFKDEYHPLHKFDERGMIAMANNGPDTNKSQFFIVSFIDYNIYINTILTITTITIRHIQLSLILIISILYLLKLLMALIHLIQWSVYL